MDAASENNLSGRLVAVCISERKGQRKTPVKHAVVREDWGIEGDAHAGKWHRQISILSLENIESIRNKGLDIPYGTFGENLVIEGLNLADLPIGTRLRIEDVILEISQFGKECHTSCEIRRKAGDCIMPREGIFAKVLHGGILKEENLVEVF